MRKAPKQVVIKLVNEQAKFLEQVLLGAVLLCTTSDDNTFPRMSALYREVIDQLKEQGVME